VRSRYNGLSMNMATSSWRQLSSGGSYTRGLIWRLNWDGVHHISFKNIRRL
jgi:hypothetical protein